MEGNEIIDLEEKNSAETKWQESMKWWESKRWIYNVLIIGFEVFIMLLYKEKVIQFGIVDAIIGSIIWTFFANICYSIGWAIEVFRLYYNLPNRLMVKLRYFLLLLGLAFSMLATYLVYMENFHSYTF